jgi:hypothetical protein
MYKVFLAILCLLFCSTAFSQGEFDEQSTIALRNEITGAFLLNSNGWGGSFRYAKRQDGYRKNLYTIELVNLKHPKEIKITNPVMANSNRFVYGKINFVMNLRAGIGKQKEIYYKRDKGSISIRYFYNYGPALAFIKPIYYEILYNDPKNPGRNNPIVKDEKFDPTKLQQIQDIIGKASVNKGLNEISLSPGGFCNFGFTFEFSKKDERFKAIEAGVTLDGFVREIQIMALNPADRFFIGFFVGFRFGRIKQAASIKG